MDNNNNKKIIPFGVDITQIDDDDDDDVDTDGKGAMAKVLIITVTTKKTLKKKMV
jgi:hypothetical protein